MASNAEIKFADLWVELAPEIDLITEYKFHPVRRWRFDFCHLSSKTAIEIEGAVWTQGRHTRGSGYVKDLEKYNEATFLGWRIIRLAPAMICEYELTRIRNLILGLDADGQSI